MTREDLLHVAVDLPGGGPLGDELRLRAAHDRLCQPHGERDRGQGHERQQRRDPDHHDERADDREQRGQELADRLLQRLADVVDVVGGARHQLAALRAVDERERQPVQRGLHVVAQAADHPLHDGGGEPALPPHEARRQDVQHDRARQHPAELREVDALPGAHVGTEEHVRETVLAVGTQPLHDLGLARAGRQPARQVAAEDEVGRVPEEPRAEHGQGRADDTQRGDGSDRRAVLEQSSPDASRGAPEVRRALGRHGSGGHRPAWSAAHRASASLSWERTISR